MKRYIVFDDYSNKTYEEDEKGLKELLIEELREDTYNCRDDFNIFKNNFEVIRKFVLNDYNFDYLKEQLQSFGWYVKDLTTLQKELSDYQAYKHGVGAPSYPNDCIEQTLKMIEEDMK